MKSVIFILLVFLNTLGKAQVNENRTITVSGKTSDAPTTYAVVIGISKYKEVVSLQYADRDAQVFSDFLLSKTGMNLDSSNVKLFLNEKATVNNIGNALSDIIIKDFKKGDRVIFFLRAMEIMMPIFSRIRHCYYYMGLPVTTIFKIYLVEILFRQQN